MKKINIGRADTNTLCVEHSSVSRNHAEIIFHSEENIELVDLGSKYGTFVNRNNKSHKVEKAVLLPTDLIVFGKSDPLTLDEIMETVLESTKAGVQLAPKQTPPADVETHVTRVRCRHCKSVIVATWSECPFCEGSLR